MSEAFGIFAVAWVLIGAGVLTICVIENKVKAFLLLLLVYVGVPSILLFQGILSRTAGG